MVLIAKRACAIGAIGVIASITLHLEARGAIPREGMEVRFLWSAIGLTDHPTPPFQRRPLFCPRKRKVSGMAGPRASAGALFLVSQEDSAVALDSAVAF